MTAKLPNKDPDETLDYLIDWSVRVGTDTISTSTWIVPAGITKTQDSKTTTSTTIWLSSGTLGQNYVLVNHIVTVGGRTMDQSVEISIVAK